MDFSIKPAGLSSDIGTAPKFESYAARPSTGKTDWVNVALYTIAAIAIIISAFVAGWYFVLANSIEGKKQDLAAYEAELAKLPIEQMRELSSKLNLANSVSENYPYISALFSVLEDSVENGIVYDTFDLRSDNGGYALNISGTAPDYKTVAQQYDVLVSSKYKKYIGKVVVEALKPNSRGNVEFTFKLATNIRNEDPDAVRMELTGESPEATRINSDVPIIPDDATNVSTSTP